MAVSHSDAAIFWKDAEKCNYWVENGLQVFFCQMENAFTEEHQRISGFPSFRSVMGQLSLCCNRGRYSQATNQQMIMLLVYIITASRSHQPETCWNANPKWLVNKLYSCSNNNNLRRPPAGATAAKLLAILVCCCQSNPAVWLIHWNKFMDWFFAFVINLCGKYGAKFCFECSPTLNPSAGAIVTN